ncbi:MAG: YraN family protein [Proteobacteria bacterium]|nr:YraN family protein [Pseudomonadota bacterium]
MTRERRRRAYGRGRRAEALAAWWLRLKGYRILARGFRVPAGEIDLIARRGRVLAHVEVKARPSLEAARAALTPRQRRRIERAAAAFLQQHPGLAGLDQRFDVMLLAPGRRPRHLENAWHIEEALPPPPAVPRL